MASRAIGHPRLEHGVGRVKWVHIYLYRTSDGEPLAEFPCFQEAPYICIRTPQSELSRLVSPPVHRVAVQDLDLRDLLVFHAIEDFLDPGCQNLSRNSLPIPACPSFPQMRNPEEQQSKSRERYDQNCALLELGVHQDHG